MTTRQDRLKAVASAYQAWKPTGVFRDEYLASQEDEDKFAELLAEKDSSFNFTPIDKTQQ